MCRTRAGKRQGKRYRTFVDDLFEPHFILGIDDADEQFDPIGELLNGTHAKFAPNGFPRRPQGVARIFFAGLPRL